jgi:glycosyltransferase involved in cell wall biosynthesis
MAGVHPKSRVGLTIHRLINKHHLQKQITMLGRVLPSQIINEMKRASLFVLPSHIDNSPNSLAEAMIVGMPCIASDAGGIPSMLDDGIEGLIYPHQDISSLADKVEILLDSPKQALKYGKNARQTALIRHDPKRIADKVVSMYKEVIRIYS